MALHVKIKEHFLREMEELQNADLFKEERYIHTPQAASIKVEYPPSSPQKEVINFCANNYLGLSNHPAIVAAGAGPNPVVFSGFPGLERDAKGYIKSFSGTGRTSLRGVWTGGDIITGSSTVISAMGCARKAGNDIQEYLDSHGANWP